MSRPPRFASWLFSRLAHPGDREAMLGDLVEEYARHSLPKQGFLLARLWFWWQVATTLRCDLSERVRLRKSLQALLSPSKAPRQGDSKMQNICQDFRFAVRTLSRSPGFTALVVLTLALGIGANTAVFSLVDSLILHPFDYPEQDRLVGVGTVFPKKKQELGFWEVLSPLEYMDVRTQSKTLQQVVCWDMGHRQVSGSESPENVFSAFWWGNALDTLGVQPALGRGFTQEETLKGGEVAIISHRFWQRRFGGDPGMVGQVIYVNGNPRTLVGVMPPETLIYGTDLWLPFGVPPERFERGRRQMQILARLAPGASLEDANLELETISRRIELEYLGEFEEYEGWKLVAQTWTGINTSAMRPAGLMLMGAVVFVMLLVCANLSSFFLARSIHRRREYAVRRALGAGRARLTVQMVTESGLTALAGGALGLLMAVGGVQALSNLVASIPFVSTSISISSRTLAFTLLISVATGLLLGLLPALRLSRSDLQDVLKSEGGQSTQSAGKQRLQGALVAVEVTLAVILLVGAGLVVHSFVRLQGVDTGFRTDNLLTMRLTLPWEKYRGERITAFFQTLIERVEGLPGVHQAAAASQIPPNVFSRRQFQKEGQAIDSEGRLPTAYGTLATAGYFETFGVTLLQGRTFDERDRTGTPFMAVINQELARRHFGGENPVGQRIVMGRPGSDAPTAEVIGVVASAHNRGPSVPPQPEMFLSVRQANGWSNQLYLIVHTDGNPRGLLPAVKREVLALDADQPVYAVQTMQEALAGSTTQWRIASSLLSLFALFALILAAVGIFSVVAYRVASRTQEIGLRIALGAGSFQVSRMVTLQALLPVGIGAALGLAASLAMGRIMGRLLFEVNAIDPVTIGGTVLLLAAITLLAGTFPAYRASRLDPVQALRYE